MNGLPYYKAYPRDFIEGTIGMPFELKCAYRVVLDLIYMQGGRLPDDARYISGLLGCTVRKWTSIRGELIARDKIQVSDGSISNYRADNELETLRKLSDKQAENARGPRKNKGLEKPRPDHTEPEPDKYSTLHADVRESAPGDEPEKPKPAHVTSDDLERAERTLLAAAGPAMGDPAKHHGLLLTRSEIGRWLRAGVDIELDAVPVVRARTAQPRASPITSWTYFTSAVGEAAARRLSDMTLPEIPHARSGPYPDTRRPERGEPRRSATGGYGGNRILEACLGLIGDAGD